MFNRLPSELVRQIIESAIPLAMHWSTYHNRQSLLRSLCLVCRLFRESTQSLLFEFIWIDRPSKLNPRHRALEMESWRGTIRRLIFQDRLDQGLDTELLNRILRSCQGLRSLNLQLVYGRLSDQSVLQELPRKPASASQKGNPGAETNLARFQISRIFISAAKNIRSHPASNSQRSCLSASAIPLLKSLLLYSTR